MKKLFLTLGVVLAASMSNAAYLYWQLDNSYDDATNVEIKDSTGAVIQAYGLGQDADGNPILVEVGSDNMRNDLVYAIDESSLNESYSYYIEVTHSNSSKTTSARIEYKDLVAYTSGSATTSLSEIGEGEAAVPIWHATSGGDMTPAPEPTSAILMLFGAAMLGLKRKQRRLA